MGYMAHHTILLSSYTLNELGPAHERAKDIFGPEQVSPISMTAINAYQLFSVHPDGSNEGWEMSDRWDAKRDEFVEYLCEVNKDCRWIRWCEVRWAEDDRQPPLIVRSSNDFRTTEDEEDDHDDPK